jgi:hypothetical protein
MPWKGVLFRPKNSGESAYNSRSREGRRRQVVRRSVRSTMPPSPAFFRVIAWQASDSGSGRLGGWCVLRPEQESLTPPLGVWRGAASGSCLSSDHGKNVVHYRRVSRVWLPVG